MKKAAIFWFVCLLISNIALAHNKQTKIQKPKIENFENYFKPVVKEISNNKYHTLLLVQKFEKLKNKTVIIK